MRWRTTAAGLTVGPGRIFRAMVSLLARPPHVQPTDRLVLARLRDCVASTTRTRGLANRRGAPLMLFEEGHPLQVGRSGASSTRGGFLDSPDVGGSLF